MKNYSSRRANRGKLAYRTPSSFRFRRHQEVVKQKIENFSRKKHSR